MVDGKRRFFGKLDLRRERVNLTLVFRPTKAMKKRIHVTTHWHTMKHVITISRPVEKNNTPTASVDKCRLPPWNCGKIQMSSATMAIKMPQHKSRMRYSTSRLHVIWSPPFPMVDEGYERGALIQVKAVSQCDKGGAL